MRRRIYPLSPRDLTEEQIAVAFAMTSRSPEPFDEIAAQVSAERAADFNERWVVGYGHASVAEHAIVHLAVENISRLACDALEDNRLASYTEKSSRYQVIDPGSYHIPSELDDHPGLLERFVEVCRSLFDVYASSIEQVMSLLGSEQAQREGESNGAYSMRLRRQATDACRAILPAATFTNVGFTANARTLEHTISKLMSSSLAEEREIGDEIRQQARSITPTLVKYADHNPYLEERRRVSPPPDEPVESVPASPVTLIDYDRDAGQKLAAALLYRNGGSYAEAQERSRGMSTAERLAIINESMRNIGPHDATPREFELVGFTFEFTFDYGAMREFRRHRMQTYIGQPLTVAHGCDIPPLIRRSEAYGDFCQAVEASEALFADMLDVSPAVAQYAVTHGHRQRVLSRMSLRECYHLFKLRSSRQAHRSIRLPTLEAMRLAVEVQPELFRHLRLRNAPEWWPFASE